MTKTFVRQSLSATSGTLEPRCNKPLYTILFSPAKITVKCMGQNLDITNTIQKPKRIIYPDITNKCYHVTKDKYETDQQESKSFNSVPIEQLQS